MENKPESLVREETEAPVWVLSARTWTPARAEPEGSVILPAMVPRDS